MVNGEHFQQSNDQLGMVANPGQLKGEKCVSPVSVRA